MKESNNVANVSTTRGVKGGYLFSAPIGTPLPDDIKTPLHEAFACGGFVSSDGFKEGVEKGSTENITDMNGDNVDSYSEGGATETLALTLIEMASEPLGIQYGHKNVTERDGMIVVDHNWSNAEETRVYVLELVLKNGRRWRKVINEGKVTELSEFEGNATTAAGREITITYITDGNGSGCRDYIELTPGSATGDFVELDSMTVDQLKAYAQEHSIDITGKTTKAEILAAIKAYESGE